MKDFCCTRYTNWAPGEPNNQMWMEDCASLKKDGRWNDYKCFLKLSSVCEYKVNQYLFFRYSCSLLNFNFKFGANIAFVKIIVYLIKFMAKLLVNKA